FMTFKHIKIRTNIQYDIIDKNDFNLGGLYGAYQE
ncbi:hypothetical protein, partial [Staphylococcus warneri]